MNLYILTMVLVFYGVGGNPVATTTIQTEHTSAQNCTDALDANKKAIGTTAEVAMAVCNKR